MKMIRKFTYISNQSFSFFRNLYSDDGKSKDNKTPEPSFAGDDADGKDGGTKGRRSRSIEILDKKIK
jgi:hypothetical protein